MAEKKAAKSKSAGKAGKSGPAEAGKPGEQGKDKGRAAKDAGKAPAEEAVGRPEMAAPKKAAAKPAIKPAGRAAAKAVGGKPKRALPKKDAWVDYSPGDVEKLIVNLGSAGHNSAEIGLMLAKQYAVPSVKAITGKRVEKILAEHKLLGEMPRDLLDLIKKAVALMKHMEENKKDMSAKRGYGLTVSKIRRLAKYYTRKRKIPSGWRYTPEEAMLLVK